MDNTTRKISNALISVYNKNNLLEIVELLNKLQIKIYSTGGTYDFIKDHGFEAKTVESLTGFPSILGGRVKTIHPKIFGAILGRSQNFIDNEEKENYNIPTFDLVIVDLYPFSETVNSGANHNDVIEKIDIGGISLIRAASKNYNDVVVVPSSDYYSELITLLKDKKGSSTLEDRKRFATYSFAQSSLYDAEIFNYFSKSADSQFLRISINNKTALRYGENPHQSGSFYGNLNNLFEQVNGKEISYNNLLDIDAAFSLIKEFDKTTFAILKHNNACGLATRDCALEAYKLALAGDPLSAFGGIIITNSEIDLKTANEIDKLFFEVLIAPKYSDEALSLLVKKKNRIILKSKEFNLSKKQIKSLLNGFVMQDVDSKIENENDLKVVTVAKPDKNAIEDMLFANKIVKHSKSNAIVIAKDKQLIASGVGQTSRVDAMRHAIEKALTFGFDLNKAVVASDAYFPFADSVQLANEVGIKHVIQPGGSIRDNETIDFCNKNSISMLFTGNRHFKH